MRLRVYSVSGNSNVSGAFGAAVLPALSAGVAPGVTTTLQLVSDFGRMFVGAPDEFAPSFAVRAGLGVADGFLAQGKTLALFVGFALAADLPGTVLRADATLIFLADIFFLCTCLAGACLAGACLAG